MPTTPGHRDGGDDDERAHDLQVLTDAPGLVDNGEFLRQQPRRPLHRCRTLLTVTAQPFAGQVHEWVR